MTGFLEQTAIDYCLPIEVVKDVFDTYGLDGMYQRLEDIISNKK